MSADLRVPIALGFRAGRGGSVVVGVAAGRLVPRVVLSTFLATCAEGDRLAREPYHVAAEMTRGGNARFSQATAAVFEGRRRQDELAAMALHDMLSQLRQAGHEPVAAALLINRAGWIADLLQYSLGAPEHPAVAEGLAVRDALRSACGRCGIEIVEMDEKSLPELASSRLALSADDVEIALSRLGTSAGRPWRKEQKLACLSAWVAISAHEAARI